MEAGADKKYTTASTSTITTTPTPMDVSFEQMSETPQLPRGGAHHRRAHSDTFYRFDDLLLFDASDLDLTTLDIPSANPAPLRVTTPVTPAVDNNSSDDNSSSGGGGGSGGGNGNGGGSLSRPNQRPLGFHHFRSLSVDSDFFEGLGVADEKFGGKATAAAPVAAAAAAAAAVGGGGGEREGRLVRHRHSNSMDSTSSFEVESLMMMSDAGKKALGPDRLAELALIDPKRAKRLYSNFF